LGRYKFLFWMKFTQPLDVLSKGFFMAFFRL